MKFSKREVKDLIKAWFFISLAFAILFSSSLFSSSFLIILSISGLTVGLSFLVHELMHKKVAMNFGFDAEFKAFDKMLWLALIMSFFGFIIAAPGAVMIKGLMSKEKSGKISLSGPLSNLILSFIFLIPFLLIQPAGLLNTFFMFGIKINALLAVFNLLPVPGFDGRKVYNWNKIVWTTGIILSSVLFIFSFFIL